MACVASGMSHTSGDVTLDMHTSTLKNRAADWTPPRQKPDGGRRTAEKEPSAYKFSSP